MAKAVLGGDEKVSAAVRKFETYLAIGMVNLTNIFNPSDIVLGGAMRPILELCLDRLREKPSPAGIIAGTRPPAVSLSTDNHFECAIGAAAIAHHEQFDNSAISLVRTPS